MADKMSEAFVAYFDHCYFQGAELYVGTRTLAAVLHRYPWMGRYSRQSLP